MTGHPPAVTELVPEGQTAGNVTPGDLVFMHKHGPVRSIIRFGQWIRRGQRPWARITHVACVVSPNGDLVEAVYPHVRLSHLSIYHEKDYALVRAGDHMTPVDRAQAVNFALSRVGCGYGYITFAGIAVRLLTPGPGLFFGLNGTEICSGLAAQFHERGWSVFPTLAAAMSPAELARHFNVSLR